MCGSKTPRESAARSASMAAGDMGSTCVRSSSRAPGAASDMRALICSIKTERVMKEDPNDEASAVAAAHTCMCLCVCMHACVCVCTDIHACMDTDAHRPQSVSFILDTDADPTNRR